MRLLHLIAIMVLLCLLNVHTGSGEEGKHKKVKCKEHIDAALKQYWDHEKEEHIQIVTDDNDNDSDEEDFKIQIAKKVIDNKDDDEDDDDDDEESSITETSEKDDSKEEKKSFEKDDHDDSKEDKKKKKVLKSNLKKDDDDDDDDESDEKVSKKESKKEELKEAKKVDKKDDSVEDDDDDNKKVKNVKKVTIDKIEENKTEEDDSDEESEEIVIKKESKKQEKVPVKKEAKDKKVEKKSTKIVEKSKEKDDEDDDESDEDSDEETRSRSHIEEILRIDEIETKEEKVEQNLINTIFRDLKRIYENAIKPLELLYKYRSITNRLMSDSEIFAKPLVMFIGAKSSGKTTLINYLLGLQKTPWELSTGQATSQPHFTIINHGKEYSKLSSIEFAADMQFSNLQQFGESFIEQRIQALKMPLDILQRMTIVDSPSLVETAKAKSTNAIKSADSDVFQWFFDRSDVIYVTLDVNQLHMTNQMQSILEQLKGRDVRFILNKVDTVKHGELILLIGQLFWILSPLMPADRPPQVYALTTSPMSEYDVFLDEQEQLWLTDLSHQVMSVARIESRISSVRRHAVRVRNHAKLVDCYLATYYKHKSLFMFGDSAKKLAQQITQNPQDYNIFGGNMNNLLQSSEGNKYNKLNTINSNINIQNNFNLNNLNKNIINNQAMQNVSRFDLPDAQVYKAFFSVNSLLDFKPLSSTCSFFRGCPIDKLDVAIAYQLPDLVSKYKKLTKFTLN